MICVVMVQPVVVLPHQIAACVLSIYFWPFEGSQIVVVV